MPVIAQIDPVDFLLILKEALKDKDVCKSLNAALDFSVISKEIALEVGKQIKVLKEDLAKKDTEIKNLKTRCDDLEKRNDALEQYTRENSLRFAGLEEIDNENPTETVIQACNSLLKVKPPIEAGDIDNAHRLGEGTPRALIVKFTNFRARRRVFEAKRNLKNPNKLRKAGRGGALYPKPADATVTPAPVALDDDSTDPTTEPTPADPDATDPKMNNVLPPIFVNEDLTKARNNLLYEARLLKREMKVASGLRTCKM